MPHSMAKKIKNKNINNISIETIEVCIIRYEVVQCLGRNILWPTLTHLLSCDKLQIPFFFCPWVLCLPISSLDEKSQKVQTSSYKINKYCRCNVQQDKYNEHCSMFYMKVVKRVNPKNCHHKKKIFYFFNFVCI